MAWSHQEQALKLRCACSIDNHQAGSVYDELYERYLKSDDIPVPPDPPIVVYVKALLKR